MLLKTSAHEWFEGQARRTPDAPALIHEGEEWTYRELNARANRLAHYLGRLGVSEGARVGLSLGRCPEAVVAILAALKTGAAYVPLDPNYPQARLEAMAEAAAPAVVLAKGTGRRFADTCGRWVDLAERAEEIGTEPASDPVPGGRAEDAYVLFTSGSTGRPRGVVGHHGGIVNRIRWMLDAYPLAGKEVFCWRASLNVVDAVWDVFQPLVSGCALLVMPERVMQNHETFIRELRRWEVSRLSIAPAHLRSLLHHDPHPGRRLERLRILDITGEQISAELARQAREAFPGAVLLNRYGCTEVPSTMLFDLAEYREEVHGNRVPIGREIGNASVHILGPDGEEVPEGAAGELCIAGAQVAVGYLNEPELTGRKFVCRTMGGVEQRLYRTGDLARRAADGQVLCLGRQDGQVKVRGNRVEIDEVEAELSAHPEVEHGAVVLDRGTGEDRLKACYVARGKRLPADRLRQWLRGRLPEHMVPDLLVPLERMPMLPGVKIDRRALEELRSPTHTAGYVAPRDAIEGEVSAWVGELCSVERVGVRDNFFDLGLDSLSAMELVARVQRSYGVEVTIRAVFAEPTVADLARRIKEAGPRTPRQPGPGMDAERTTGVFPMSYPQRLLWRLDRRLGRWRHLYNDAWAIRLRGPLDGAALQGALDDLVRRQAVLRTGYAERDGEEVQVIREARVEVERLDLGHLDAEEQARQIREQLDRARGEPFDLERGPLLRAQLIRARPGEHVLLLATHHITEDAASGRVINRELGELYDARVEGRPHRLPPLRRSYADFARWQEQMVRQGVWEEQLAYWREQLEGMRARPTGLLDHEAPLADPYFAGAERSLTVPGDVLGAMRRLAREEKATPFMTLLAGLYVALHRYTGEQDLVIGSPSAHRHHEGVEDLVGFFPNMLCFRQSCHGGMSFRHMLREVKDMALAAYANQDLPFVRLADTLGAERGPHHPLVTMTFIMPARNPRVGETLRLREVEVELLRLPGSAPAAKFDFNLSAIERSDGLHLHMLYNRSLFEAESIERLLALYATVLREVGEDADATVGVAPCPRGGELIHA